jgi:hypothetical protein
MAANAMHSLWNETGKDRILFLTQAQTSQLLYCASCCILHPRNEFDEEDLGKSKRLRSCKWPGIFLTGRRLEPTVSEDAYLTDLDIELPWAYEYNYPESDSRLMELSFKRDENDSIISTSKYLFYHERDNFVANKMACPRIALEDLFITLGTGDLFQTFACSHCRARILG